MVEILVGSWGLYTSGGRIPFGLENTKMIRWMDDISTRPAYICGATVNRIMGQLEAQLRERHSAEDFETKTQDKIEAAKS